MSTLLVIPASDHLVRTVLRYLDPEGNDYSPVAVVFPGKRPAHFLRKELAARHGSACIPPRVFSFESLTDFLYLGLTGESGGDVSVLDACALLYEIHLAGPARFGGGKFDRLDAFLPLGIRLFDTLEELRMHRISPDRLRAVLPLSQFPNADRLAGLYESFYERLSSAGLATRSMRLGCIASRSGEIALPQFRRIIVAGFYAFTPLERALVGILRDTGKAVFIFQEGPGLAARLGELGEPSHRPDPDPVRPGALHFYKAGGTHAEVFALNHVLQALLDRGTILDERTVVVLPSADALFPVAEWTLPLVPGGNYNVSLGYPSGRTPAFGFLSSLLQLIVSMDRGRFYGPDYVGFMVHPYMKNILLDGKPEATRVLVHAIEESLAGGAGAAFLRLERLEQDDALLASVALRAGEFAPSLSGTRLARHLRLLHDTFIRSLLKAESLGAFARVLIDALTFIDEHSSVREHELFRPCALALLERLDVLASSRLAAYNDGDRSAYCTIVSRWLREASVPFPGTPVQGLQVLGLLETRNLQFERVCMLDVNEDVLPGLPDVDPLLPPPVRLALHLPLPEAREAVVEYHCAVLLAGAAEAHLFYQEGGKKERSRVIERLFWEEERRRRTLLGDEAVTPVLFNVTLANRRPEPIDKTALMSAALDAGTLTSSALDTYLRCPLRFYYGHLLGLREKARVEGGVDAAGIGTLVHEVLKTLDGDRCGSRLDPSRIPPLGRAIDEVFTGRFGDETTSAQMLLRDQIEHQLGRYLAWYRRNVLEAGEVTLLGLEVPLKGEYDLRRFSGVADRIERRGDRTVIIDYKTGGDEQQYRINVLRLDSGDRSTWLSAIRSFQLPLYLLMHGASAPHAQEGIEPIYVMLGDPRNEMHPEVLMFDPALPRAEQWEKITRTLSAVLRDLFDPTVPFAAPEDLTRCCPACSFTALCGTAWVRGGR